MPQPCLNCALEITESTLYCPNCGQKVGESKKSIWAFFKRFFNIVFNVDSKFFRSAIALFIPGKLTKEYFAGKHRKYAHPLRSFFILAAIHISIIGYLLNQNLEFSDNPFRDNKKINTTLGTLIDSFQISTNRDTLLLSEQNILDSLKQYVENELIYNTESVQSIPGINIGSDSSLITKTNILTSDIILLTPEEISEKYEIKDKYYQLFLKQWIKAFKEPENLIKSIIANLIWLLFVLLPVVALFMKFLYIRRKRYFIEHLVFLFHWHSFAFIIMSIYFLLYQSVPKFWIAICLGIIVLFGYFALRRYYKDGFFKSIIKYSLILSVYVFSMGVLGVLFGFIMGLFF